MPAGHWTRNLLASPDGSTLYVGVGSSSNIAENGMNAEAESGSRQALERTRQLQHAELSRVVHPREDRRQQLRDQ